MNINEPNFFPKNVKLIVLVLTIICCFLLMGLAGAPATAAVWHHLDGRDRDVNPQLMGPAYDLGGGGADVDRALQWTIDRVRGCEDCSTTLDLVIVRTLSDRDAEAWEREGTEPNLKAHYLGYHELFSQDDAQSPLQGLDSIETFVFSNPAREDADRAEIAAVIEKAEVVFFAGGDQCQYVRNFKGTALESALESLVSRGGGVGGTSAGAMIQGEWIFNACSDTVVSEDALADPYEDLLFTENFFPWPALEGTIVDTHFYQRDRMGRAITFAARLLRDGSSDRPLAIGIDEHTSLAIDREGRARVMSDDRDGSVYFILGDRQPDTCEPKRPLSVSDYRIWRVQNHEVFDLKNIPQTDNYPVSIHAGQMSPANPYNG